MQVDIYAQLKYTGAASANKKLKHQMCLLSLQPTGQNVGEVGSFLSLPPLFLQLWLWRIASTHPEKFYVIHVKLLS